MTTERPGETTGLARRVAALETAHQLGQGRIDPATLNRAASVLERTASRRELSAEHTVIGFFGATGSGKSSLFNAVIGRQIATSAARRPTTATAQAAIWGREGAEPLLDWLGVENHTYMEESGQEATQALNRADLPVTAGLWNKIRRSVGQGRTEEASGGLVLLDLPDFDSVQSANRQIVEKMAACVDVLVWVLDPQKYADAVIHRDFITPLASHGAVTLAVLNQADRLTPDQVPQVLDSLKLLLAKDGLTSSLLADPLAVSARTLEGVPRLREILGQVAAAKSASLERIQADLDAVSADLAQQDGGQLPRGITADGAKRLEEGLYAASGAEAVLKAAAASYRLHAAEQTGWIVTRWLLRLKRDPLKRLGLHRDHEGAPISQSSLPPLGSAQKAGVSSALRTFADDVTGPVEEPWSHSIRDAARTHQDRLPAGIERALATVHYGAGKKAWWWYLLNALQWLGLSLALAGLLWLTALALAGYLQVTLPAPPRPEGFPLPLPTLCLTTGLLLGLVTAALGRLATAAGHRLYTRGLARQIRDRIQELAQEAVFDPVEGELQRLADYRAALEVARGD